MKMKALLSYIFIVLCLWGPFIVAKESNDTTSTVVSTKDDPKQTKPSVHKVKIHDKFRNLNYITDTIHIMEGEKNFHLSNNGGLKFEPLDSAICGDEGCISSYEVSPLDSTIVTFTTNNGMFLCDDIKRAAEKNFCGELKIPAHQDAKVIRFEFHPTDRARALMLVNLHHLDDEHKTEDDDKEHRLYITSNLMKSNPSDVQWEHMMSHVLSATWGDLKSKHFNSNLVFGIRVIHHSSVLSGGSLKTFYSLDLGSRYRSPKDILKHAHSFLKKDKFIVVSTKDTNSNVNLHVSEDNAITFREGSFFPDKRQVDYTILDASEGSVFVNVFHHDNEPSGITWGNVFHSDSTGSRFTISLSHNKRLAKHADFQKIQSMEGVYIANVVANHDDPSCADCAAYPDCLKECKYVSRITFNKGGEWHPITAPDCDPHHSSQDKHCQLHFHGFSSYKRTPIHSKKNAIGIILATGNKGSKLEYEEDTISTYISRDAGLTWSVVSDSLETYAISHHGGLILMGNPAVASTKLKYSFTEGKPFHTIDLDGQYRISHIYHNEKNELSKKFLVPTHQNEDLTKTIMLVVDFSSLDKRECIPMGKDKTDYEYFKPHSYESECLLGRKIEYVRKKKEADCFDPEGYEKEHNRENCKCSYSDFMCDFGYKKHPKLGTSLDAFECVPVGKSAPDKRAPYPCDGLYNETRGYTRVAGDSCIGGLAKDFDPILRTCPGGLGFLGSIVLLIFFALLLAFAGVLVYKNNPSIQEWFENVFSVNLAGTSSAGYDPVQTFVSDRFSSEGDDEEPNDFDESVFANEPVEASPRKTTDIPLENRSQHSSEEPLGTSSGDEKQSNIVHLS